MAGALMNYIRPDVTEEIFVTNPHYLSLFGQRPTAIILTDGRNRYGKEKKGYSK